MLIYTFGVLRSAVVPGVLCCGGPGIAVVPQTRRSYGTGITYVHDVPGTTSPSPAPVAALAPLGLAEHQITECGCGVRCIVYRVSCLVWGWFVAQCIRII